MALIPLPGTDMKGRSKMVDDIGTPYWLDYMIACSGSIIVTKTTLMVEEF